MKKPFNQENGQNDRGTKKNYLPAERAHPHKQQGSHEKQIQRASETRTNSAAMDIQTTYDTIYSEAAGMNLACTRRPLDQQAAAHLMQLGPMKSTLSATERGKKAHEARKDR